MDDLPADIAPEYMIESITKTMQAQNKIIQRLKCDSEMIKKGLKAFYHTNSNLLYRVVSVALLCGVVVNLFIGLKVLTTQNPFLDNRFHALIAFLYLVAISLYNGHYQLQKRKRTKVYLRLTALHNRQLEALTISEMIIQSGERLLQSLQVLQYLKEQQNADLLRQNTTTSFNEFCQTHDAYNQLFNRLQQDVSAVLNQRDN